MLTEIGQVLARNNVTRATLDLPNLTATFSRGPTRATPRCRAEHYGQWQVVTSASRTLTLKVEPDLGCEAKA